MTGLLHDSTRKSRAVVCIFVFLCAASALAAEHPKAPDTPPTDLQTIVSRMESAASLSRELAPAYVLTREFQIFSKTNAEPYAQVLADVSFVPPASRTFQILSRTGSSRGEGIVRRLLQTESKATSSREGEITRDNYDFALLGLMSLEGKQCYLLGLTAKRPDQRLVNGQAWIDAETYAIRRIEGGMAKLPSWWLRSVNVVISFASVGGMWMQSGMTAVADVRILGKRTFTSRVVSFRTGAEGRNTSYSAAGTNRE